MKNVFAIFGSILSIFGVSVSSTTEKTHISISQLEQMFAGMKAETKWNVDGPLLWGYFFMDKSAEKLRPIADELTKTGYRLVNIYPTDDKTTYVLHVEKIEHHTVESLNKRNAEFYRLADKYHVESYDGMDAGPAP